VTFLQVDNNWLSITRGIEFDIQLFFSFSQKQQFFSFSQKNSFFWKFHKMPLACLIMNKQLQLITIMNKGANIMRMNTSVEW